MSSTPSTESFSEDPSLREQLLDKREQLLALLRAKELEMALLSKKETEIRQLQRDGGEPTAFKAAEPDLKALQNILGPFEAPVLAALQLAFQLPASKTTVTSNNAATASIENRATAVEGLPTVAGTAAATSSAQFNILVVGAPGLGANAYLQQLLAPLVQSKEDILALTAKSSNKEDEVAYSPVVTVKYQSSKLNLRAAAIDLTNEQRGKDIVDFVQQQHQAYFERNVLETLGVEAPTLPAAFSDLRPHVCVFLLPPYGRTFAPVTEALTLLALAPLVNVIPVVARAECLSSGERLLRSYLVQESLQNLKAPLFTPSVSPSWPLFVPTLVPGLDSVRTYPWASVDVGKHDDSDLGLLQELLWAADTANLVESTNTAKHAFFRKTKRDRLQRRELGLDDTTYAATSTFSEDNRSAELAEVNGQLVLLQKAIDALQRKRQVLVSSA